LHPQKFGCTPKNEGKRVHVPPDEKNLWAYWYKLSMYLEVALYIQKKLIPCK
jgi:hypothetical protein